MSLLKDLLNSGENKFEILSMSLLKNLLNLHRKKFKTLFKSPYSVTSSTDMKIIVKLLKYKRNSETLVNSILKLISEDKIHATKNTSGSEEKQTKFEMVCILIFINFSLSSNIYILSHLFNCRNRCNVSNMMVFYKSCY